MTRQGEREVCFMELDAADWRHDTDEGRKKSI